MSFPRYPAYKDSGVEWLGDVPEHWEVWKLSHAFTQIGSGTTPKTDNRDYYEGGDIPWVNTGDFNDRELDECDKRITELAIVDHSALKTYPPGSLLIAMYGATIGKLAILNFAATVNQACCVFAGPSEIASKFMFYWFLGLREQIISLATGGGQPNISQDILRSLRVAIPVLLHQAQIVSFLDHQTSTIDDLIAEQQRLIELLQEKRQVVISHAVTKGLNPNAPMKDSGVEWLGQVPEHWTAQKASWLFRAEKGKKAQELTQEYCGANEGPFPVFSGQTKDGGVMGAIDSYEFDVGETGAILCTTVGAKAMSIRLITGQFSLSQNCMVITSKTAQVTPAFFEYGLQPLFKHERALIPDHMQPSFRMEDFNQFWVQVPPIDEQARIAKYLQEENQASSELATAISGGIGLLQERRSALISAAVTGQIDVRGLVEVGASEQ